MTTIKIGQRGVITLPKNMRESLGITEGGVLGVREQNGALILEPHRAQNDTLLADIRSGLQEIKRGEYIEFSSVPELHRKAKQHAR